MNPSTELDTPRKPDAAIPRVAEDPRPTEPLRLLADAAPLGVMGFDEFGVLVYRNPIAAQWSPPRWQVHPDDRATVDAARHALRQADDRYEQYYRLTNEVGQLRWIKESAVQLATAVDGIAVVAHQLDVTDTISEATRLNESLQRHEGIVRAAADPIITLDASQQVVSLNHAAERLLGISAAEVVGRKVGRWLCWGDEIRSPVNAPLSTGSGLRLKAVRDDGAVVPVDVSVSLLQLRSGLLTTLILRDAREPIRVQQRLEAAEAQQRMALQAAGMGNWQFDVDAHRLRVSVEAREVLGCSQHELLENFDHLTLHIHPADRDAVTARWLTAAADGLPYEQAYRVLMADGVTRWVGERGRRLDSMHHRRLLSVVMDITERKQLETDALRYARILEESRNEIYLFAPDSLRFVSVNQPARLNLGYSLERLREMTPLDLKPGYTETTFRRMIAPLAQGRIQELRFNAEHRRCDGTLYPVEVVLRYSAYALSSVFVATILDVTEQRQRETELAAMAERLRTLGAQLVQVQEHERRHLARELHDEIGQQLTAALIEVRNPELRLPRTLRERWIQQFGGLIEQVRTLSLDLSPAMLDDLGLVPALRGYAQRQAALGGLALTLELDESLGRLSPEMENALFRIAQEAMTNVLRHAHATTLTLALRRVERQLQLSIADNGCGLPPKGAELAAHFGMVGMRERAALLGGELNLESAPGAGLRVVVHLPLPLRG